MIIGISGKINSGKDTVGRIIQIITDSPHFTNEAVVSFLDKPALNPKWEIRRFADKLKDIVCMLLSCTREQLENREFKEKELREEWWYYKTEDMIYDYSYFKQYEDKNQGIGIYSEDLIKLTPRLLLQLLGTECGRRIIHPNIWINALMSKYDEGWRDELSNYDSPEEWWNSPESINGLNPYNINDWIIADLRFENELKAVKDRDGITIRVNRPYQKGTKVLCVLSDKEETIVKWQKSIDDRGKYQYYTDNSLEFWRDYDIKLSKEHESETSLDNSEFDYTIDNDGTLLELVEKVREILTKEKIV